MQGQWHRCWGQLPVSWEPTLCSSSRLHGHAGSLKSTRVGAFTPQNSATTTHQHYFSQKVRCAVCTSTPPLQAEDNGALHAEQWTGQQGLCTLSEGSTQILENKSLPCRLGIINSFISHNTPKSSDRKRYLHCLVVSIHYLQKTPKINLFLS